MWEITMKAANEQTKQQTKTQTQAAVWWLPEGRGAGQDEEGQGVTYRGMAGDQTGGSTRWSRCHPEAAPLRAVSCYY